MEKEAVKEVKKENKTNKLLIVIIVLLAICVGVLGTIAVMPLLTNNQEKTETTEQEEKVKEIKDIDVITDLSIKIDTLLTNKTTQYYKSHTADGYNYRYGILKGDTSAETKQFILLQNADWGAILSSDYSKVKETELYKSLAPSYGETYVLESTKQVSLDKVSVESEKLFGEKITTPVKSISRCPSYSYEESTKTYYMPVPQCGGINFDKIYSYKSKFEEKSNEAYVYVSFGYAYPTVLEGTTELYAIYKDFDLEGEAKYNNKKFKNIYQENLGAYNVEHFEINSTNYQDFSEYKFTFQKDEDNNYYFVKVEQTK